jgi:hypothetical protein
VVDCAYLRRLLVGLRGLAQPESSMEPPEWTGCPPVGVAEQGHGRWDEQAADQGGVDEYRDRQGHAHLLHAEVLPEGDAEEGDHDERRGRGDDPAGPLQPVGHRVIAVTALVVALLDAGQQEHLVVHRQAEREHEHHDRHPRLDGAEGLEAQQPGQVTLLEDPDQGAERRAQ